MTVLNTVVASQLKAFKKEVDKLIKTKKLKKDDAIFNVLRDYIKKLRPILFEGDGYSETWAKEAKRRGLTNTPKTPDALKARVDKQTISLFEEMGVMNATEVRARYEIQGREYVMRIQIESRVARGYCTQSYYSYSGKVSKYADRECAWAKRNLWFRIRQTCQ
jgi:glutamine synthetase